MTGRALNRWRIALGVLAALLLGAMTFIGETRIKPAAPDGQLLQVQLFGYDTHTLHSFMFALQGAAEAPTYLATLLVVDSLFIAALSAFIITMLWPHRALALSLAALYAAFDIAENALLLMALSNTPAALVAYFPEPGQMSVASLFTSLKFASLAVFALALLWRWTKGRA